MAHVTKAHRSSVTRTLLMKSGLRPKKGLGQHFLEDPLIIEKIVEAACLDANDVIVEIGSGLGALTIPVLPSVLHVVAIEKDAMLTAIAQEQLSPQEKDKATFISKDVLKVNLKEISGRFNQKLRIIGNLPYNISSPFLDRLVIYRSSIKDAILMFQIEFAQRLIAAPGGKSYGSLSVISQYYGRISPVITVSRDSFYPRPKVDSMVVKIDLESPYPQRADDNDSFQRIVKAAFSCRRKTIFNSLQRGVPSVPKDMIARALTDCRIDPKRRAETLTIDEYIQLSSALIPGVHETRP